MSKKQVEELIKKAGDYQGIIEKLLKKGEIREIEYQGEKYYIRNFSKQKYRQDSQ